MDYVTKFYTFLRKGLSDAQMSCLEMVTLLCMGDKTHSQLMELMPEHCGTTQNRDFESVLAEVCFMPNFKPVPIKKKRIGYKSVRLNLLIINR